MSGLFGADEANVREVLQAGCSLCIRVGVNNNAAWAYVSRRVISVAVKLVCGQDYWFQVLEFGDCCFFPSMNTCRSRFSLSRLNSQNSEIHERRRFSCAG